MAGIEFELNETDADLMVLPFVIVDSVTGDPSAAALVAGDFKLLKNGAGAFVNSTNAPAALPVQGAWAVQLVTAELDTEGPLGWMVTHAGVRTIIDFEQVKGIAHRVWGAKPIDHRIAGSFGEQVGRPIATVVANIGNTAATFKTDQTNVNVDAFKDAWGCFLDGALQDQTRKITAYDPVTGNLTFAVDPFTAAPVAGTRLVIINK